MKRSQQGFTLIELIVVVVLLGIIGAVATARFQDLSTQAADAVAQGVAAEVSAGGAINMALRAASNNTQGTAVSTGTENCATYANAMLQAGSVVIGANVAADEELTITPDDSTADCSAGAGNTATCNVIHSDGAVAATFVMYCTG